MGAPQHRGLIPPLTERTKAKAMLVRCPICGLGGPKARMGEHVAVEHPGPRPAGFVVSLPPFYRPMLERLQQQTGRPFSELVTVALDNHYAAKWQRI